MMRWYIGFVFFLSLTRAEADGDEADGSSKAEAGKGGSIRLMVVGAVHDSTARILLELDRDEIIHLPFLPFQLAPAGGPTMPNGPSPNLRITPGAYDESRLLKGLPVPITFTGLLPSTRYFMIVEPSILVPKALRNASFRTLPAEDLISTLPGGFKVGVVSGNKLSYTKKLATSTDLWYPIADDAHNLDMIVHLGDNVFMDDDRYIVKGGVKIEPDKVDVEGVMKWCKFCEAEQILEGLGTVQEYEKHREIIIEKFRSVYRDTWSHPPTARAMANIPNIFIIDDHETRDDWGDARQDVMTNTSTRWLARLAYEVAWEYQYALMTDKPFNKGREEPYMTYVFGDVGVLFVDVRYSRTFMDGNTRAANERYLGEKQWKHLKKELGSLGSLSGVKGLIVAMPVPVVLEPTRNSVEKSQVDDVVGMWDSYPEEQSAFLTLLSNWKKAMTDRELVVVAGDLNAGAMSRIYYNKEAQFSQMVSSAIANSLLPTMKSEIESAVTPGRMLEFMYGYSARHEGPVTERNFGKITIKSPPTPGRAPLVLSHLYISNSDGGVTCPLEFNSLDLQREGWLEFLLGYVGHPFGQAFFLPQKDAGMAVSRKTFIFMAIFLPVALCTGLCFGYCWGSISAKKRSRGSISSRSDSRNLEME